MFEKVKKYFPYMLMGLVCIQPLLDLVWFNNGTIPEVFGFTIPTLVRVGFVGVIGLASLALIKWEKNTLAVIVYLVSVIGYFIFHHLNCLKFTSLVPGDFNYSLVGEMFYIVRMLIPFAITYFTGVIEEEKVDSIFDKTVTIVSLFMSGLIVITNLLKVSISSYSDYPIKGNIIDWFLNQDAFSFNELTSKGFFYHAIVTCTLVMSFPYFIYKYIHTKEKKYIGLLLLEGIALLMVGTKATSFSVIIELSVMILVYLFCSIIKKDIVFSKSTFAGLFALMIIFTSIYWYSPCRMRMDFSSLYGDKKDQEKANEKEGGLSTFSKEEQIAFFEEYNNDLSINPRFLNKSYPYEYDLEFWMEMLDKYDPSERMQNRIIEEEMFIRIKEINNNPMDDYLGIGFTRTENVFKLEQDFLYQCYSMGIIGAGLLMGPYIALLLYSMIDMLRHFKKKANIFNCALVLGLGLTYFVAFYSGNTMESLGVTITIGFVQGYLLKKLAIKE